MAELGLGLAALGRPAYINLGHGDDLRGAATATELEQRCHAVLDAAAGHGVRYFDLARGYGRAEVFAKRWLESRGIEPGAVTIASKWGYAYTANFDPAAVEHERKDHSLSHLEAQWELSRAALWEYLDIYQIHSATLESGVLDDEAVLGRLARLKEEDGVRVGLSVSGPDQAAAIDRALAIEFDGRPLFEVVQATMNLLERAAAPALAAAHAAGRTVVVKEALANGRLAGRDPEAAPPALAAAAAAAGVGPDAVALAAVLHGPPVSVVLSGAATEAQLASNSRALDVPVALARALWDEIDLEPPASYWARRRLLPWT